MQSNANDQLIRPAIDTLAIAPMANLGALFQDMQQLPGSIIEQTLLLSRHNAFPMNPMFHGVWNANLTEANADAAIEDSIAWFKSASAPMAFWWTTTLTQPADLGERLQAHGFAPFEIDAPAMIADIDQLNWDNPRPANLRVERVQNERQLDDWKRMFVEAFEIPEFAAQAWVDATKALGIGATPWHMLVGYLDGTPVASAMLYCGAGAAGLIQLGVIPSARRMGIGSAMQLERLKIARTLGYRHVALFASVMGHSPYLKLGFKDTGIHVSRYLWRPSEGEHISGRTWTEGN
jgi:GNAT superfamily N-acetyltransferase